MFLFCVKIVAYIKTGSSSLLAEAIHSLGDFANQILLVIGIRRALRKPDLEHPYGYAKERFVWSLISACGVFCVGAGASVLEGMRTLMMGAEHTHQLVDISHGLQMLAISGLVETGTFGAALRAVLKGAALENKTVLEYMRTGSDPTAVAVLLEDAAAVTGVGIAATALLLTQHTGDAQWDAIGSIAIGGLLGTVAVFLIRKNSAMLVGQSMSVERTTQLLRELSADSVVGKIVKPTSEVLGPGAIRFKAEVDFKGSKIARVFLSKGDRRVEVIRELRRAALQKSDEDLHKVLEVFGEQLLDTLGTEVDRLEKDILRRHPDVVHVDLEAH